MNKKRTNGKGGIEKRGNGTYRVRVHETIKGKTKRKVLKSNIKTREEAERILEEYNTNPWDLDTECMTLKNIFDLFYKQQKSKLSKKMISINTMKGYIFDFKRCKPLHRERFKDIRVPQLENFINNLDCAYDTKKKTKSFLVQLYNFAIRMEYINLNKAKNVIVDGKREPKDISIFTDEEIKKLWKYIKLYDWIDVILIMIYTGYRIGEIVSIKKENVDLENRKIKGGNKTVKGKNRKVPIVSQIYELVKNRFNDSKTDYLLDNRNWKILAQKRKGKPIRENYLREKFYKIMKELGMNHKPHDTRRTLATLMSRKNINESIIKDVMGHTKIEITQKYYIQNNIETVKDTMEILDNFGDRNSL